VTHIVPPWQTEHWETEPLRQPNNCFGKLGSYR